MDRDKNRLCLDCLHCKVSSKSKTNRRLCFCAVSKKRERHRERFWLVKKTCQQYEAMV